MGGRVCVAGGLYNWLYLAFPPIFWVARSNQITGMGKTPLGREIWLMANPVTENWNPGNSTDAQPIPREISREIQQPGNFPGDFLGNFGKMGSILDIA